MSGENERGAEEIRGEGGSRCVLVWVGGWVSGRRAAGGRAHARLRAHARNRARIKPRTRINA